MTDTAELERVALAIEATMFAQHELPLPPELHAKYLETARAAIAAQQDGARAGDNDHGAGEPAISKPTPSKVLFSVLQMTDADDNSYFLVDWHPDMYPLLDAFTPEGKMTDRLIDFTEELMGVDEIDADDEQNVRSIDGES